jgi:transposase-like protein
MSEEPREKWDRWPTEFRQRALERVKTSENVKALAADSEGCRSPFRTDVDHDSEVMPISVPN